MSEYQCSFFASECEAGGEDATGLNFLDIHLLNTRCT